MITIPGHTFLCCLIGGAALLVAGCRSATSNTQVDRQIQVQANAAVEAYAEGQDTEAIRRYRNALKRAWAIDDPVEIGNNAYNLAACLASVGWYEAARDCLAEARAELYRAGRSEADAWLLEAKIARSQGLLEEAYVIAEGVREIIPRHPLIQRVSTHFAADECCPEEPPVESSHPVLDRLHKLKHEPRDGSHKQQRQEVRQSTIALHLLRANLACDTLDLEGANEELATAERKARHLQENEVPRAEILQVRARIFLLSMQPSAAALRLDAEADLLRAGGHYREIPLALSSAGEAYLLAGDLSNAGVRFYRVGRILYGRDDLVAAVHFVDRALTLAVTTDDVELQARLALLFHEIDAAWQLAVERERSKSHSNSNNMATAEEVAPPPADQSPQNILAPEEASPPPPDPDQDAYIWLEPAVCIARPWPVILCGRLQRPPGQSQPLLRGPFGMWSDDVGIPVDAEPLEPRTTPSTSTDAPTARRWQEIDPHSTSAAVHGLRNRLFQQRQSATQLAKSPASPSADSSRRVE